jgi:hypothetical protein
MNIKWEVEDLGGKIWRGQLNIIDFHGPFPPKVLFDKANELIAIQLKDLYDREYAEFLKASSAGQG